MAQRHGREEVAGRDSKELNLDLLYLTKGNRTPTGLAGYRPSGGTGREAGSAWERRGGLSGESGGKREERHERASLTASGRMLRKRRRKALLRRRLAVSVLLALGSLALPVLWNRFRETADMGGGQIRNVAGSAAESFTGRGQVQGIDAASYAKRPDWTQDFLTVNEYSRPGEPLYEVKNIFVHYTANPKTSAVQNRSYFEQLKDTGQASASAHFIIGYEGEILQCLPLDEIGYAVATRNEDSISIECCYLAQDGSFTRETYDALVRLLGWLLEAYRLEPQDILRHYDCGGKKCPVYYVENEAAWARLKQHVQEYLRTDL
ncbi:MAG: N-acetylmuramoyl-L-alanine amidase [Clostridium sp.]|nr:N-acetylmuramoyl-L-alanine amidase [Clostridium sp.]